MDRMLPQNVILLANAVLVRTAALPQSVLEPRSPAGSHFAQETQYSSVKTLKITKRTVIFKKGYIKIWKYDGAISKCFPVCDKIGAIHRLSTRKMGHLCTTVQCSSLSPILEVSGCIHEPCQLYSY
jgi:hypothetical protein